MIKRAYVTAMRRDCADDVLLRKWIERVMRHMTSLHGPGIKAKDCTWQVTDSPQWGPTWVEIKAIAP